MSLNLTFLQNQLDNMNLVFKVLGVYGVVQILAQNLGIKTGQKQKDLIQSMPFQMLILFSGAYTVSNGDYKISLMSTGLYYFLKYIIYNKVL